MTTLTRIAAFLDAQATEAGAARNTILAYGRDLRDFAGWMETQDYRHAFYMGLAAGSASAFSENLATRDETAEIYRQVAESR